MTITHVSHDEDIFLLYFIWRSQITRRKVYKFPRNNLLNIKNVKIIKSRISQGHCWNEI